MPVMTLSGWGQPYDALFSLSPHANHFDYAEKSGIDEALAGIAEAGREAEMVIGWSLGGQLAVRAIAGGLLKPKHLILIAAPFEFLSGQPETYRKFRDSYARDAARTLDKAWELVAMGDAQEERVRANLARQGKERVLSKNWLYWLEALDGFSCKGIDFSGFPPTLIIHGGKDAVVASDQAQLFADRLPQAMLAIFEGAGHAPHWHDTEAVKRLIAQYTHV